MDYLDPEKKRAHKVRLYVGYVLMVIAIVLGARILLTIASGFYVDSKTGQVYQNGTIVVDNEPEAATIFLNGIQQRSRSSARLTVPAGVYNLELKRDGYRSWRNLVNLDGGTIERVTYPRLFPVKLETQAQQALSSIPNLASQSPDRRWLLMQLETSPLNFLMFDSSKLDQQSINLTMPATALLNPAEVGTFNVIDWASDNRHVLMRHDVAARAEYILFDREEPVSSININKQFGITPVNVQLRDRRPDQLYSLESGGVVRTIDIKGNSISAPVLTKVIDFKPYGDNALLYITDEGTEVGAVMAKLKEDDKTYPLHELPVSPSYLIDIARYDDAWQVAVGSPVEDKVYVYTNPVDYLRANASAKFPVPVSILKVEDPLYLSFSTNNANVGVQRGSEFSVFDIENNRQHNFEIPLNLDASGRIRWMDGYHLSGVSGGKVFVIDYDGTNLQVLDKGVDRIGAFYDRDYDYSFSFAPAPDNPALLRTLLKLKGAGTSTFFRF